MNTKARRAENKTLFVFFSHNFCVFWFNSLCRLCEQRCIMKCVVFGWRSPRGGGGGRTRQDGKSALGLAMTHARRDERHRGWEARLTLFKLFLRSNIMHWSVCNRKVQLATVIRQLKSQTDRQSARGRDQLRRRTLAKRAVNPVFRHKIPGNQWCDQQTWQQQQQPRRTARCSPSRSPTASR